MAIRPRKPEKPLTKAEQADKEAAATGGSMPLTGHLKEMRNRIAVVLIAFVACNVVLITRAQVIVGFLTDMGRRMDTPSSISPPRSCCCSSSRLP